jgi:hypothetical protein
MGLSQKRRKEILQGCRTGGNLLLGFVTFTLLLIGTIALSGGDTGRLNKYEALAAYAVAIGILYWKAPNYSGSIAGFFGVPGIINGISMFFSGHMLNQRDVPISHLEALSGVVFCVALTAVTFQFLKRRALDRISRVCIVLATLIFAFALTNPMRTNIVLPLSLLFFGFAAFHAMSRRERRRLGLARKT